MRKVPAVQEMQEKWVQSLGQEGPLEEGRGTHSSILAGESHGQRSLVGYSPQGHKESNMTKQLSTHTQRVDDNYLFVKIFRLINER